MTIQDQAQALQYQVPYHHLPRLYHWNHALEYEVYLAQVVREIKARKPKTLIDVGCGDGRLLKELYRNYLNGVGIDLDPQAVRWARAVGAECWCQHSVMIHDKYYQMVTAIEVLEHIPDGEEEAFIKELARLTDHWLILTVPTVNVRVPIKHYRHYTEERLRELIEPWFKITELKWIIEQPWWWGVLERIPVRWHEGWLKRQLEKRLWSSPTKGRHLMVVGVVR